MKITITKNGATVVIEGEDTDKVEAIVAKILGAIGNEPMQYPIPSIPYQQPLPFSPNPYWWGWTPSSEHTYVNGDTLPVRLDGNKIIAAMESYRLHNKALRASPN